MDPRLEYRDLTPPEQSELRRGLVPALIANVLLLVALGVTLQWKRGEPDEGAGNAARGAPGAATAEPPEAMGPPASAAMPAQAPASRATARARASAPRVARQPSG